MLAEVGSGKSALWHFVTKVAWFSTPGVHVANEGMFGRPGGVTHIFEVHGKVGPGVRVVRIGHSLVL